MRVILAVELIMAAARKRTPCNWTRWHHWAQAEQRALPGKALPKLDFLRKGTRLPTGTATARLTSDPARVRSGDETDIRHWLGDFTKVAVSEESVGLGGS